MVEVLPQLERELQAQGESIPRPKYDGQSTATPAVKDEDNHQDDEKPIAGEAEQPSKLDRFKYTKPNHEATSDEEE